MSDLVVEEMIETVGDRATEVAVLRVYHRMTQQEIAMALGISQQAVCKHLRRVRAHFPHVSRTLTNGRHRTRQLLDHLI